MRIAILALTLVALVSSTAPAAEEGREVTWDGYLWTLGDDEIRLGWGVIAMGVMAMPDHFVEGELGEKLRPLVSDVNSDYYFWNYSLAERKEEELAKYPRVLVKLRGRVQHEEPEGRGGFGDLGNRRMTAARLLTVEFVNRDWLTAWSPWFTGQPASVKVRPGQKEIGFEREFAPKALAALRAMRKVPGPTDAERKLVAGIDPEARVVERFRKAQEAVILRWLIRENEELELGLGDLEEEFGRPPPTTVVVQRWFLESPDRKSFLAKVGEEFDGDLEALTLAYYVTEGNRTSYTLSTVLEVAELWSDEDYARHLATTKEIFDR